MKIFNVAESLVSNLEPNNNEYFYKISESLKDFFFFYELPEELAIPSSNVNTVTKINKAMNDSNKNTLLGCGDH